MDPIPRIGPPGPETQPVERVVRRDLEDRAREREEEREQERRRGEPEPPAVEAPAPPVDEDDDSPHVDVIA